MDDDSLSASSGAQTTGGRDYVGSELEVFAAANNWKRYFKSKLDRYIHGDVLEIGAGIGSNTKLLANSNVTSWVCLEPDTKMSQTLHEKLMAGELPAHCSVMQGVLSEIPEAQKFDAILYVDVLEHIEADAAEVVAARRRLRPGGHLVVLSPAHQALYTAFDKAIGHYRRYSIETLTRLTAPPLQLKAAFYLDSVGSMASIANKMLLKSAQPTRNQIKFWDTVLVSASKVIDPMTFHRLGKTVVVVWQEPA
jgi:SAM-dependent methyltransferase